MIPTSEETSGFVVTFYSFKGGVGRSMALANIALVLHRGPLNVIVVDWDLEAPGLGRYFAADGAGSDSLRHRPGLTDLLQEYLSRAVEAPRRDRDLYPDIDDYLVPVMENDGASLRLLPAGSRADWDRYADFVQGFDWSDFYENFAGGGFFEWLREGLASRCDLVLIDSRTGVTEMGGVATHHMADLVVVLFSANEENMDSSVRMARSFTSPATTAERGGRALPALLVPSRIDDQDSTAYSDFVTRLESWMPSTSRETLDLLIPYKAVLSYREQLIPGDFVLEKAAGDVLDAYRRIALEIRRAAPKSSAVRRGVTSVGGRQLVAIHDEAGDSAMAMAVETALRAEGLSVALGQLEPMSLVEYDAVVTILGDTGGPLSRTGAALVASVLEGEGRIVPVASGPTLPPELADFAPVLLPGAVDASGWSDQLVIEHDAAFFQDVAWAPDGNLLAASGRDATVRVWDAAGSLLWEMDDHDEPVFDVAWSPNGLWLASGGNDGCVLISDAETGTALHRLECGAIISDLTWSPDGTGLAAACADETVRIWDVEPARERAVLSAGDGRVGAVAWSPDGSGLASAEASGFITLWDLKTEAKIGRFQGHTKAVYDLEWSPDGGSLASAGRDHVVRLWRPDDLQSKPLDLDGHYGAISSIAWSGDGTRLASASYDQSVRIWDVGVGRELARLEAHSARVTGVDWSPHGNGLVTSSVDGTIRLWVDSGLVQGAAEVARAVRDGLAHIEEGPADAFLSYASADAEMVLPLAEAVRELGCGLVHDRQILRAGDQMWRTLRNAQQAASMLVLAVTPKSVQSRHVLQELAFSAGAGQPILPVLLGDVSQAEMPPEVIGRRVVDLTGLDSAEQARRLAAEVADEVKARSRPLDGKRSSS